jgi:nucleotide-binding universal stress UspA family protein
MFQRIMVPVDGTVFAEGAVATAASLAAQHGAELHLVFVKAAGDVDGSPPAAAGDEVEYRDHRLQAIANTVRATHGVDVTVAAPRGPIIEALRGYAVRIKADLIVMATHGWTGLHRAVVGSFADALIHAVHVPVLLLRGTEEGGTPVPSFRRIMVALDGSAEAEAALFAACAIAKSAHSTLVLAQVVVPVPTAVNLGVTAGVVLTDGVATQHLVDEAASYLENAASEIRRRDGIEVDVVVDLGMAVTSMAVAARSIARLVQERQIDLVVLTTRERRGSRLLLRSVADRVLDDTGCALLLCHKGFDGVEANEPSLQDAIDEMVNR